MHQHRSTPFVSALIVALVSAQIKVKIMGSSEEPVGGHEEEKRETASFHWENTQF
jgi:hypothetical protein